MNLSARLQEGSHRLRPKFLQPNILSLTLDPKGRVEEQGKHMRIFLLNYLLAIATDNSGDATPVAAFYVTAPNGVFLCLFLI